MGLPRMRTILKSCFPQILLSLDEILSAIHYVNHVMKVKIAEDFSK
jgi:hypothetical protein